MPIFTLKFLEKHEVARNTFEFRFNKPQDFNFIPGQYGGFTLPLLAGAAPGSNNRRFSLISSPTDAYLAFTTRLQDSPFKRQLAEMIPGMEIKFAGPTGQFILPSDAAKPVVLIAGGIGIAPFLSMMRHQLYARSNRPLLVFYGNRTPEDAPYFADLAEFNQGNITLIHCMSQADASWKGETGFIEHTLIKKHVSDITQPEYFVCGAPTMVTALHETLLEMGINEDQIHVEDFPGYR